MATEFEDTSAIDFILFMNNPNSLELVHQEYNTMDLNRRSFEENGDDSDNSCLHVLHQLLSCLKTDQRYRGANFIDGFNAYNGQRKYICLRNPELTESEKFWELVWCREVTTIVMADRKDEEYYQYWSPSASSEIECGGFRVETLTITNNPRYVLTVLRLTDCAGRERQILHYRYTSGLDDPLMFLSFACSLNDSYAKSKKKKPGAVVVHCKDSVSCSAVYCLLDICITQIKHTGTLSVANTLSKMHQQKYHCLNNIDDYIFCYRAIHMYVLGELGMSQKYLEERNITQLTRFSGDY